MKKLDGLLYRHFIFDKGGVTFVIYDAEEELPIKINETTLPIKVGVAYCSPKDQYCRRTGRELALKNMDEERQVFFVKKKDSLNMVFNKLLISLFIENKIPKPLLNSIKNCNAFHLVYNTFYYVITGE